MLKALIIIGIFVAVFIYAYRSNIERAQQLEAFATARGWSYSRLDKVGMKKRLETMYPDEKFSFENVMTVENGTGELLLFDCGVSKRTRNNPYFTMGGLIETPKIAANTPAIGIFPRSEIDKLLDFEGVEVGSQEFSKVFHVSTKNKQMAEHLLNSKIQSVLLNHEAHVEWKPVRLAIGNGRIVVFVGINRGDEAWPIIIELLKDLEKSI
ncbi:MAG: hypothetical protein HY279_04320 [Nitrospinae bacterium]|nr:hypothetical protein [Nitrospinota bacterium]